MLNLNNLAFLSAKVSAQCFRYLTRTIIGLAAGTAVFMRMDGMQKHLNQLVRQMFMTKSEMQSAFGHGRRIVFLAVAFAGVLFSGWADNAYLPAVGPSPLRYLPPFKPKTNIVVLPPPVLVPATAPVPVEKAPPAPVAPAPVVVPEPIPANIQTNAFVEPPRTDGVVSPQMLLKYFNKSTNANAAGVDGPLDFNPPRSAEPPSSKAEYSTPPH